MEVGGRRHRWELDPLFCVEQLDGHTGRFGVLWGAGQPAVVL